MSARRTVMPTSPQTPEEMIAALRLLHPDLIEPALLPGPWPPTSTGPAATPTADWDELLRGSLWPWLHQDRQR